MSRIVSRTLAMLTLCAGMSGSVHGQSIVGRMRDRARDALQSRANNTSDAAVDSALARGEQRIRCVVGDEACIRRVQSAGRQVVVTDSSGTPLPNQPARVNAVQPASAAAPAAASQGADAASAATTSPPGHGAWLNYDFVPGNRVIWWEDFSGDDVGDFPRRMSLIEGNFEVVNIRGHKYLRTAEGGRVAIVLPDTLPSQFTVEVHYYSQSDGNPLDIRTSWSSDYASFGCYRRNGWVAAGGGGPTSQGSVTDVGEHDFVDCRFTISDRYVKAYINEHRTANVPTTHVAHTDSLILSLPAFSQEDPTLITDIRIAAGGRRLYDALSANGRVATQGILFDTGSDRIRGESTPTLKEIGDMLTEHADLRLTIEGHTDNVGAAATNQSLSERRAAAVRQYLIDTFHVDASRLMSAGFGATHPAAPNTTPEGRQTNRRVELVRIS